MKVLNFEIFGDFAHFRPYYTTSSPTTYTIMPITTAYGLIGAILGLDKNNYYEILKEKGTRLGIGIQNKVKKITLSMNLINTKGNYWIPTSKNSSGPRTPTRYEFLKDTKYSLFVTMEDEELLSALVKKVQNHTPYYTISLGLANLLADIKFIGFDTAKEIQTEEFIDLDTAIDVNDLTKERPINLEKGITYAKERFVKVFKDNREPQEYIDILYSLKAEKISVKTNKAYQLYDKKFTFLS